LEWTTINAEPLSLYGKKGVNCSANIDNRDLRNDGRSLALTVSKFPLKYFAPIIFNMLFTA
jgi:hypothetical protein